MDRWERIQELFHGAADLSGDDRTRYLDDACGEDAELRREVESLLAHEPAAQSFIERSALEVMADTLDGAPRGSGTTRNLLTEIFSSPLEDETERREPVLQLTTPRGHLRRIVLEDAPISVGRDPENSLSFPEDDGLSRQHLLFLPEEDGWMVRNLGSKNGTFVNGRRIDSEHPLEPGDEVTASCVAFRYLGGGETQSTGSVRFETPETGAEADVTAFLSLAQLEAREAEASAPDAEETKAPQIGASESKIWAFARAARELGERRPMKELFQVILDLCLEAVAAERGVLLTLETGGELVVQAVQSVTGETFNISTTVRDRVLNQAHSLLVADIDKEEALQHTRAFAGQRVRSLIAVPLQTEDQVIGMLYLDSGEAELTDQDLTLITAMAHVASMRIERERWEQQRRVLISDNLESLSRLAATISHELNTPLGTLKSTIDSLLIAAAQQGRVPDEKQPQLDALQSQLKTALDLSLERMHQTIERMQRFTNLDGSPRQELDLHQLLSDLAALRKTEGTEVSIAETPPGEAARSRVFAGPRELSEAFGSLIAFLASPEEPVRVAIEPHRPEGSDDRLRILLTGLSREPLPPELERIFEPGFRVDSDEGRVSAANWRLYGARQLLRAQGGEIEAALADGARLTLTVHLPRAARRDR